MDKSKIVDVDSLFALDPPTLDETASTTPASSVFFDSAPTAGRASRFRQLFAQEPQRQAAPAPQETRLSADRAQSNLVYGKLPKSSASAEDREGFQRIMAMLGSGDGAGRGKPNLPSVHSRFDLVLTIVYG